MAPSTPTPQPCLAQPVQFQPGHADLGNHAAPPPHRPSAWAVAGVLAVGVWLGGCASVMRVDSDVTSHANWPTGAYPTGTVSYIFERMPSQLSGQGAMEQNGLEQLAQQALASKGWQLLEQAAQAATPAPPWRVQVSASQTTLPRAPWDDAPVGMGPRWSLSAGTAGVGIGLGWGLPRSDMPYHLRQVQLVVRDPQQGRVAYEAKAAHDGRWNSTPAIWRAMLDAALTDFPHPSRTQQRVDIDVPR